MAPRTVNVLAGLLFSVCVLALLGAIALAAPWLATGIVSAELIAVLVILLRKRPPTAVDRSRETPAPDADRSQAQRMLHATQAVIDSLPHAVLLLSPDGHIQTANATAALFDLKPGLKVDKSGPQWLQTLVQQVSLTSTAGTPEEKVIQIFHQGQEMFFVPHIRPLLDSANHLTGMTVVLQDVTQLRQIEEAKSGLLSSVSHELKTPLTSMQMSIHLLLEDAQDRLTPRQLDLLQAARDDTDRLHRLIEEILETGRRARSSA